MSQTKKAHRRISVTINPVLDDICQSILTPEGFHELPRGSYSLLVTSLLTRYAEQHFDASLIDILAKHSEVGADAVKIAEALAGE